MTIKALIFDVDGTLAETEEAHRNAFNRAFGETGLDWHWDPGLYRSLLKVSGGKERLRAFAESRHYPVTDVLVLALHRRKTEIYTAQVATGAVPLRPGIARLLGEARQAGLRLAIATTTTRANVIALMAGTGIEPGWFETMACSDDAPLKKPHPQVYETVLSRLNLPPSQCLAIEDSANGLRAAQAAGLAVIITPSLYTAGDDVSAAKAVWPDLGAVSLAMLTGEG